MTTTFSGKLTEAPTISSDKQSAQIIIAFFDSNQKQVIRPCTTDNPRIVKMIAKSLRKNTRITVATKSKKIVKIALLAGTAA